MTSWSDWKDDEKPEAALRSLVATNLKHKEIFGLVCRDFPDYEEHFIVGFGILKYFILTKIYQQTLYLRQLMLRLMAQESYKNTEH